MKLKELRLFLEGRIEDLGREVRDMLTGDDDGEFLITLGKISAYQTVLENYVKNDNGYVPKHGRE